MKEKILNALKQAYAALGLGDTVLGATAEALASTGFVTDENLDAIVKAQESALRAVQKSNDKRVADALAKAKADSEEQKKQSDAALAELNAKIEALTKKETKTEPKDEPKKDEPKPFDVDAFKASLNEEFGKKFKSLSDANKALTEQLNGLVNENNAYKAQQAEAQRQAFILSTAKQLGIPEWRVNEGFSIAADADETAITNALTTVATNIKANMLPQEGVGVPALGGDPKETEERIGAIATQLVSGL